MKEAQTYFDNKRGWAKDTIASNRISRRIAWIGVVLALAVVALQSLIIIALLPENRDETKTILVDRTTGYTQVLDSSGAETLRADEALTQSLLAQYIVSRERRDPALLSRDYRKTALWSSGTARQTYISAMSRDNTNRPSRFLQEDDRTFVEVKSVSQLTPTQALVRFDTFREGVSNLREPAGSWIAAVTYSFVDSPMSFDDRLLNPLGFQVSAYRRDPERPTESQAPSQRAEFIPETSVMVVEQPEVEMELIE